MNTETISIHYTIGDATDPPRDKPGIIIHVCNDIGGWGKGFVRALSQRWKQPEQQFRAWANGRGTVPYELGQVQFVQVEAKLWVANVIGQHGIGRRNGAVPVRYEAIRQGLKRVAEQAIAHSAYVHGPRLGCGLAGGTWTQIEPLIVEELTEHGVDVWIYDLPT